MSAIGRIATFPPRPPNVCGWHIANIDRWLPTLDKAMSKGCEMGNGRVVGIELISAAMGRYSLSEFSTVERMSFSVAPLGGSYDVEMVVSTDRESDNFRMRIRFRNVSGLQVREFGGTITQLLGLQIRDISDRGWQQKNWQVGDFENARMSLLCEEAEILAISPRDPLAA